MNKLYLIENISKITHVIKTSNYSYYIYITFINYLINFFY